MSGVVGLSNSHELVITFWSRGLQDSLYLTFRTFIVELFQSSFMQHYILIYIMPVIFLDSIIQRWHYKRRARCRVG